MQNQLDEGRDWLVEELQNFQEIARCLNPSPGEIPRLPGVDIYGFSRPLRGVLGGDHMIYVDFARRFDLEVRLPRAREAGNEKMLANLESLSRRCGILVADVSGHRMTDALVAAMLHQAFLLGAHYELDLFGEITTRIFEHINTRFYRTTSIQKYFTMIYGEIFDDGKFRFVSAGHQPPKVFSREYRKFAPISEDRLVSFPPVGLLPSGADPDGREEKAWSPYKKSYKVNEIDLLAVGDILLLYTDGLSEHDEGRYFPARVESLFAGMPNASAREICERLQADLVEQAPPVDDVSVVVIRKTAASG
jgi:serine phosphatase RsbU (regulator of sigma subunit)